MPTRSATTGLPRTARPGPGSPRRPRRGVVLAVAATSLVGPSLASGPGVRATAAPEALAASDEDRVAFWLERLLRGPEPGRVPLAHYHQRLLEDALRNLERLAEPALRRLADPAIARRIQHGHDLNPWHNVLALLARIGPRQPEVARLYARPGLAHPQLIVRRHAVEVLVALATARAGAADADADAPALLRALRNEPDDRVIVPAVVACLVRLPGRWAAEAARAVLERGTDDGAGVGSLAWAALLSALDAPPATQDAAALCWTALVAQSSAPRAARPTVRNLALAPEEPRRAVTTAAVRTTGSNAAAAARAILARRGGAAFRAAVAADLTSDDPDLRTIAATAAPPRARAEVVADGQRLREALRAKGPLATPEAVAGYVTEARAVLGEDGGPLLRDLLDVLPPEPPWGQAILRTFDAVRAAGVEPVPVVARWLLAGRPETVDLALRLVRHAADGPYADVVEAWLPDAGPTQRVEARRTLAYLYAVGATRGAIDRERVAAFAKTLRTWSEDPSDPSATGLLPTLLELGEVGEDLVAEGLRGPRRATYLALLVGHAGPPPSSRVVEALLDGLSTATPTSVRNDVLAAAFRIADGETAPLVLEAFSRLSASARDEAAPLLRLIAHRASRR